MKTSILILLLVGIIACSAKWVKPDFCGNSQCPHFSVEDERDGYDVRKYKEAYWVVVNITDSKFSSSDYRHAGALTHVSFLLRNLQPNTKWPIPRLLPN